MGTFVTDTRFRSDISLIYFVDYCSFLPIHNVILISRDIAWNLRKMGENSQDGTCIEKTQQIHFKSETPNKKRLLMLLLLTVAIILLITYKTKIIRTYIEVFLWFSYDKIEFNEMD